MKRNERFEKAINYLRMQGVINKNEEVATKMGADASNVSRAINGSGNNPTDRFLRRFNEAFSNIFSLEWLCLGDGEMIVGDEDAIIKECNKMLADNVESAIATRNDYEIEEAKPRISYSKGRPYYNVDFIGGFDLVFNDQTINPEYYIDFAPYNKDGVMWCNITGHSMEPQISNGDIIAIKEVQDWFDYLSMGEIYAIVTTNNLRTVKIVRKGSTDDKFRFIPINTKEFDEQEVPKKMILRVFELLACIKKL